MNHSTERERTDSEPPEWTPPGFLPPVGPTVRADGSLHYSGISYALPPGFRPLQLDLWVPAGGDRHPVVVWIHGGAWQFGDRRYLPPTLETDAVYDALLKAGIAVASIDYRLAGEAVFPAQLQDAKSAVRYLRRHAAQLGLDVERFGVWGESAGGHLAALLALTAGRTAQEGAPVVAEPLDSVRAVVDWYGVSDLATMPKLEVPPDLPPGTADPIEQLLGGTTPERARSASPITHVSADAPPFLLIHGTDDVPVPLEQSSLLHAALLAAGAQSELVTVEGAGHIFVGATDIPALIARSVAFLTKHLQV
ncbi:alpha/beta hydrolase [Streptomyces griseorubiginosus]|uniref:alpha/beta hydrolase n=1 Tax=Streptomyces griseorubiginosus TaxID=67304 RepID=UPI002E811A23|nr:alpha/beta hydrolase [Streptomyces griseorubiginosus]WUB42670.1 alpha/beta hydrolase [Streptomyces griseorubiginosus]WUB51189.1 alpha/beta hydrolase [Streptomyces griseorubiginosus]